jgi:hypothetical protein
MKKKVTKRTVAKKVSAAKVTRSVKRSQPNWTGMVVGALLVVGLGWWVYKANTQSVDINLVAERGPREHKLGHWTFDSAADFGPTGAWRTPANGLAPVLKDGAVVWNSTRSVVQIAAPGLNLDFNEPINGKYVVKVKADILQQPLPSGLRGPAKPVTPISSPVKMVLQLYSAPFEADNQRRLLGSQEVLVNLSDDMKEYEFAFDNVASKRHIQLMRLHFAYPAERGLSLTAAYRIYSGLTIKVDEISVLQRVAVPTFDKQPAPRPSTGAKQSPPAKPEFKGKATDKQ